MSRGMPKLNRIDGEAVKSWWNWLVETQCGCSSLEYASDGRYRYCVCMGWHDYGDSDYVIAWKIGRQSHNNISQCDFDMDFEMPYVKETGDVDDTLVVLGKPATDKVNETIAVLGSTPIKWGEVARDMKREARRIAREWIGKEDR